LHPIKRPCGRLNFFVMAISTSKVYNSLKIIQEAFPPQNSVSARRWAIFGPVTLGPLDDK